MTDKPTLASLAKRIEELERFVRALEAERKREADRRMDAELRYIGVRR